MTDGDFAFGGRPQDAATTLLSGLQGGLIISRAQSERASVLASVQRVLFSTLEGA